MRCLVLVVALAVAAPALAAAPTALRLNLTCRQGHLIAEGSAALPDGFRGSVAFYAPDGSAVGAADFTLRSGHFRAELTSCFQPRPLWAAPASGPCKPGAYRIEWIPSLEEFQPPNVQAEFGEDAPFMAGPGITPASGMIPGYWTNLFAR